MYKVNQSRNVILEEQAGQCMELAPLDSLHTLPTSSIPEETESVHNQARQDNNSHHTPAASSKPAGAHHGVDDRDRLLLLLQGGYAHYDVSSFEFTFVMIAPFLAFFIELRGRLGMNMLLASNFLVSREL